MSIVRVHKTSNFTVMSNYHFKERKMGLKAKGLLSLMLSLPDDWNYSISGLVTLSKDGKDSVMSALAELEKFGYLRRDRLINEKGQFDGVEYHIFERPVKEKPVAERQKEETPKAVKANEEKPPLLKTNQSITKRNNKPKIINTKDNDMGEIPTEEELEEMIRFAQEMQRYKQDRSKQEQR